MEDGGWRREFRLEILFIFSCFSIRFPVCYVRLNGKLGPLLNELCPNGCKEPSFNITIIVVLMFKVTNDPNQVHWCAICSMANARARFKLHL